ncbi:MAG: DHH family phosphoesterase [Candidatus Anstonellales archaeon]
MNIFSQPILERKEINQFRRFLREANAVHTHINPDVDAITSLLILKIANSNITPVTNLQPMEIKLLGDTFKIHSSSNKIESKLDIVVDSTVDQSTSNAPKVLVIDHHLTRDRESIKSKDLRTVHELYIIRKPCISNGLLLYRALMQIGILERMGDIQRNMLKILAITSVMGDTDHGKYHTELYNNTLNHLSESNTTIINHAEKLYKQLHGKLSTDRDNTTDRWDILYNQDTGRTYGVIIEDQQDTGLIANNMFEKYSKNIVVVSKYRDFYKISIRLYRAYADYEQIFNELYSDLKNLANRINMGLSNSQVYGGKLYTDKDPEQLLRDLIHIIDKY